MPSDPTCWVCGAPATHRGRLLEDEYTCDDHAIPTAHVPLEEVDDAE